jgi:hypothetical protein
MAATTGEQATEDREREVVVWRYEQLRRAGYERRDARALAGRPDVDLHVACNLLRDGCSRETALRILT